MELNCTNCGEQSSCWYGQNKEPKKCDSYWNASSIRDMAEKGEPMANCAEVRKWGSLMKYYTVYLKKTDEIVAFGTSEECASQLGLRNRSSFHNMASLSRKGKRKKYEIIVDESPYEEESE